jgi:hypothetical protein
VIDDRRALHYGLRRRGDIVGLLADIDEAPQMTVVIAVRDFGIREVDARKGVTG